MNGTNGKLKKFRLEDMPISLRVQAVEMFVSGSGADDISRWLRKEHGIAVARERIYNPIVKWAKDEGILRLFPGAHAGLQKQIAAYYGQDPNRLHVVNTGGDVVRQHLASTAAELVLNLIKQLGENQEWVRIGLGGGLTVSEVCQELATRLRSERRLPSLGFHAISSGFEVTRPTHAPVTFLSYFVDPQIRAKLELVGLFARSVVPTREYRQVKRSLGVRDSFAAAKGIDIVITGCATAADPHGALRRFAEVGRSGFHTAALEKAGWIADLQYIPYGNNGPLTVDAGVRAVTLFELADLRHLVHKRGGHVVVVASPCGGENCGRAKTEALRPLLRCKELAVWSHLVTDFATGEALLPAN